MILAKFTFVRFVPPIEKFLVLQTPCLRPFRKKKKSNPNRLFDFCFLLLFGCKNYAHSQQFLLLCECDG